MGVKTEEKRLGDHIYKVTQLVTSKSRPLLKRLSDTLFPVIGRALQDVDGGMESIMDLSSAALGSALIELPKALSEEDLQYITDMLALQTEVRSPEGTWMKLPTVSETHWPDNWDEWGMWIWFAIQVNYKSFLRNLGGAEAIASKVKDLYPSSSPTDAIGT